MFRTSRAFLGIVRIAINLAPLPDSYKTEKLSKYFSAIFINKIDTILNIKELLSGQVDDFE